MQPDPQRSEDTRAWLVKATGDLRAARLDLTVAPPLTSDAVFHAQQLAEKALKAFLQWHDRPFRRTHDLAEVGQQCLDLDQTLEPVCRHAERLSVFAWAFRYPGDPGEPSQREAEDALAIAKNLLDAVLARLPAEVHP